MHHHLSHTSNSAPLTRREKTLLGAIFVLLGAVYSYYSLVIQPPWNSLGADMGGYIQRAAALAQHRPLGPYDSFYPVGLTYLYGSFFILFPYDTALRVIAVFQALLLAGCNPLAFLLARKALGASWGAWVSLIGCAVYWPLVAFTGFYMSEIPFAFFLLLALYFFWQVFLEREGGWQRALNAGLALGAALIIRGTLYPVVPLLLLVVWRYRPELLRWKRVLPYVLGIVCMVSLQSAQSWLSLGSLSPFPTNGAINMYLGQARLRSVTNRWPGGSTYFYNNNYMNDPSLTTDATLYFPVWDQASYFSLVKQLWKQDPGRQLRVSLGNLADLFRIAPHWPPRNNPREMPFDVATQVVYAVLVYPLILVLLVMERRNLQKQSVLLTLLVPIIAMAIIAMPTKGEDRYLLPYWLPMIVLAGVGAERAVEVVRRYSFSGIKKPLRRNAGAAGDKI